MAGHAAPAKTAAWAALLVLLFPLLEAGEIVKPMPDRFYASEAGPDEAASGVKLTSHRWPDCETLENLVQDIFRIEGARTPEDKALAVWRWYCLLVQQGPTPPLEGLPGKEKTVWDAHKLITVYGTHFCAGHGQMLAAMWRAAGFLGFKGIIPATPRRNSSGGMRTARSGSTCSTV